MEIVFNFILLSFKCMLTVFFCFYHSEVVCKIWLSNIFNHSIFTNLNESYFSIGFYRPNFVYLVWVDSIYVIFIYCSNYFSHVIINIYTLFKIMCIVLSSWCLIEKDCLALSKFTLNIFDGYFYLNNYC